MNRVVEILMKRDGLTKAEAERIIDSVIAEICYYPDEADEIMMDVLGLEPDYLEDILS